MADTTAKLYAKRIRQKCEYCHGRGHIEFGAGLLALQKRYPDWPLRAMVDRGWLGFPDEDDEESCARAFLAFCGVASHEELLQKQTERREFPWNARAA